MTARSRKGIEIPKRCFEGKQKGIEGRHSTKSKQRKTNGPGLGNNELTMENNKRRPSEKGEWETGCFSPEANNLALIALTWSDFSEDLELLPPRWVNAVRRLRKEAMATTREELERISLGWLLTHYKGLYERVAAAAASVASNSPEQREEDYKALMESTDTIRDWFCWLHRDMVERSNEENIQLQNKSE